MKSSAWDGTPEPNLPLNDVWGQTKQQSQGSMSQIAKDLILQPHGSALVKGGRHEAFSFVVHGSLKTECNDNVKSL